MTSERSKRRDFLSLIFISKSISKKLLIKIVVITKGYGVRATTIESQNACAPALCFA